MVCNLFDSKNIEKKMSTLFLIGQKVYSVNKMNLQYSTCSHSLSYYFSLMLFNSLSVSCVYSFLELFYDILKVNKYTLEVCIIHFKSHLNICNTKKQTQNYAWLKRRHCIPFLVFSFKKQALYYPSGLSTFLAVWVEIWFV